MHFLSRDGLIRAPGSASDANMIHLIRAMLQGEAQRRVSGLSDLTNNAGGTPSATFVLSPTAAFTSVANAGTNLAQKTAGEAALVTVKDAMMELVTRSNAAAALLGLNQFTNSIGGTAADGTVGAITVAVTAASTGWVVATANTVRLAIDAAMYNLAIQINKLAAACGVSPLVIESFIAAGVSPTIVTTLPAMSTDTGTAADPGVSKAAADAALTIWRTNITTMATRLNAMTGTLAAPLALAGHAL